MAGPGTGERAGGNPARPRQSRRYRSTEQRRAHRCSTPEFAGITFHEVLAKSALNHVPGQSAMPFGWTINPYRGCSHACVYCFARNTHTYLDLDAGKDFDSQIIVKVNVAEVLATRARQAQLGAPSGGARHQHRSVPAGRGALPADAGHHPRALPTAARRSRILTKGSLLRRDLPLLAAANEQVPVDLAMSIAVYDDELQQSVEPGTPSTAARLATVTAAREHGLPVTVFLMPILPYLTDTRAHLDAALERVAASGASAVMHTALHLRPGTKRVVHAVARGRASRAASIATRRCTSSVRTRPRSTASGWPTSSVRSARKHGLARGQEDPGDRHRALPRAAPGGSVRRRTHTVLTRRSIGDRPGCNAPERRASRPFFAVGDCVSLRTARSTRVARPTPLGWRPRAPIRSRRYALRRGLRVLRGRDRRGPRIPVGSSRSRACVVIGSSRSPSRRRRWCCSNAAGRSCRSRCFLVVGGFAQYWLSRHHAVRHSPPAVTASANVLFLVPVALVCGGRRGERAVAHGSVVHHRIRRWAARVVGGGSRQPYPDAPRSCSPSARPWQWS